MSEVCWFISLHKWQDINLLRLKLQVLRVGYRSTRPDWWLTRALTGARSALGSWRVRGRCGPQSSGGSSAFAHSWTWQSRTWRPGGSCRWWERDALSHCSSDPPWTRECVRPAVKNPFSALRFYIWNKQKTLVYSILNHGCFIFNNVICTYCEGKEANDGRKEHLSYIVTHLTPLCLYLYSVQGVAVVFTYS